ncbi:MAG TPA: hypothetical protein VF168_12345 [Trueperaceae bacterium]
MPSSTESKGNGSLNDTGFAHAVDALLWISPSGDDLDNSANYKAVAWSLEERKLAVEKLRDLVSGVLPSGTWRTHPELAAPLLEAHLFLDWLNGDGDSLGKLFADEEGHLGES